MFDPSFLVGLTWWHISKTPSYSGGLPANFSKILCQKQVLFFILFWDGLMSGLIVFWTIFCYAAQMTIQNPSLSAPMFWDYRHVPPTKLHWSVCRAWVRRPQLALKAAMNKILQGSGAEVLIPFSMSVNWLPSVTWHLKVYNFRKSLSQSPSSQSCNPMLQDTNTIF